MYISLLTWKRDYDNLLLYLPIKFELLAFKL